MRAFLKRLRKDKKGNVLVLVGTGTLAMVGGAGLGVDTVQWFLWKRQLQQAVDSSALAGGNAKAQGTATWRDYASHELDRNANTNLSVVRIVSAPQEGAYTGDSGAVEVVATTSRALPFSGIFITSPPVMRARAVATAVVDGEFCVVSLAETGTGIKVAGTADVLLGCGVSSNSASQYAINFEGGSYLSGTPLSAVGGIDYTSTNVDPGTSIQSYGVKQADPVGSLYSMSNVPNMPCDRNNFTVNPTFSAHLSPPTTGSHAGYMRLCNGLTVRGELELDPGVYVIDGGEFEAGALSRIRGQGVTFILTGNASATVATLNFAGTAEVRLRAPNQADDPSFLAPEWYGMLFYQDPIAAVSTITNVNRLTGDEHSSFEGITYMPSAKLTYAGNSGMQADCLMLISHKVEFIGEASINNNCPSEIDDIDWGARIVRVVE